MKIIFLDLEGPIVTSGDIVARALPFKMKGEEYPYEPATNLGLFANPTNFGLVLALAFKHQAKIVVSSVLRKDPRTLDQLLDLTLKLIDRNLSYEFFHPDWRTADLGKREEEILHWVDNHPGVQRWVAIDDRQLWRNQSIPHPGYFCQVRPTDGFTFRHYEECRQFFTEPGQHFEPEIILL